MPLKRHTMARVSPNAHADCACGSSTSSDDSVGANAGDDVGTGVGNEVGTKVSVGDGVGIGVGTKVGVSVVGESVGGNDDEMTTRGDRPSRLKSLESTTWMW